MSERTVTIHKTANMGKTTAILNEESWDKALREIAAERQAHPDRPLVIMPPRTMQLRPDSPALKRR